MILSFLILSLSNMAGSASRFPIVVFPGTLTVSVVLLLQFYQISRREAKGFLEEFLPP
jgi:F0F1-type ATP synthase membrane subunit a